jgi:beta-glucosidase
MKLLRNSLVVSALAAAALMASAQTKSEPENRPLPWMNKSLSPDQRADLVLKVLSLDQKTQLLHGTGDPHDGPVDPHAGESDGGSGYVPGFPILNIPGIQMDDSALGVAYSGGNGRYSTALPSDLGLAASWDEALAEDYGTVVGKELRDQGYNMSLGVGVNLAREPRDGRTFEYAGEDPLLAGTMAGHVILGVQAQHVIGDIKHFAVNDQDSGRHAVSSEIGERAMRETDLLAFQIGIEIGHPGAVMCAYNRVNGIYACENPFLLKTVLKGDWHYPGFVISDWLATHSTVAASHAGLDQEEPGNVFFDARLKRAVNDGNVSQAELNDHVRRVLRSMFAAGVVDDPPVKQVPEVFRHAETARRIEEQSIVLLRNEGHILPLHPLHIRSVLVVGRNAERGMISGGGSAQVDPPGGNAIGEQKTKTADWQKAVWFPDAPLAAMRAAMPDAKVSFDEGSDPAAAAKAARGADLVLFFAYQWQAEGIDLPTLALPDGQDASIAAVAAANPHTVVVLETGGPVLMPWIKQVAAVLSTWYSGTAGSQAIADVLTGAANPSGKLPITFPLSDADLPHPKVVQPPPASQEDWSDEDRMSRKLLAGLPSFPVQYDEGLKVGYRWYEAEHKPVLFPFGFGLSYTTFAYSDLKLVQGKGNGKGDALQAKFTVKNTGQLTGQEIAEIYTTMPAESGEPPKRLAGWTKCTLAPGEKRRLSVSLPAQRFAIWDEEHHAWKIPSGEVTIEVGPSSAELPQHADLHLGSLRIATLEP